MHPKVGPLLADKLKTAQDYDTFEVDIFMREKTDQSSTKEPISSEISLIQGYGLEIITKIRDTCTKYQQDIVNFLERRSRDIYSIPNDDQLIYHVGNIKAFWISNSIYAKISIPALEEILDRDDVEHVELSIKIEESEID